MNQRGQIAPIWAIGLAAGMLLAIAVGGFFAAIPAGLAYLIGSAVRVVYNGWKSGKSGVNGLTKGITSRFHK